MVELIAAFIFGLLVAHVIHVFIQRGHRERLLLARRAYENAMANSDRLARELALAKKNYMPGVEYDPGAVIERLNGRIDKC